MKHRSSEGAGSSPPNPHPIADYGSQENHFLSPAHDSGWRRLELDEKKQLEGKGDDAEAESPIEEESSEEQIDDDKVEEEQLAEQMLVEAVVQGADGERPKLAEGFYEVEAIRKKRVFKGEAQYLIKWRGWPESANTWEPMEHLQLCPDVVETFELSLNSGKKTSRKRKRKYTQAKKKMQCSYGQTGSKGSSAVMKKIRGSKKADDYDQANDPSQVPEEDSERIDDSNSSGELGSRRRFSIQLPEPVKPGNDAVNSGFKNESSEPSSQGDRPIGAKRRKSGSVRRFKPETVSCDLSNHRSPVLVGTDSLNRAEELIDGNVDAFHKNRCGFLQETSDITRIIKPVGYSTSVSNNIHDVLVTFLALRGDGQEVTVDNKFLKANNPLLLIDFYEQHLRYSTTTTL